MSWKGWSGAMSDSNLVPPAELVAGWALEPLKSGETLHSHLMMRAAQWGAEQQRDTCMQVAASLAAAISLLERGGKKAAPSDKMFEMMLSDYKQALETFRAQEESS